jgi:pyruvate dehydrogenase E1 component alpha subunit
VIDETLRRVLDDEGRAIAAAPDVPDADLRAMYRHMLMMRTMDTRMLSLQRQGRIGFYGLTTGQEASVTGSAYPLLATDWIFPALRETGVSMWRGTTVKEIVCQLIGNSADVLIGRQMPMHFSDRRVNSVAWSSVIGTQLVHAMGAAWAARILGTSDVMVGYIGDGGTSSSDFHAATATTCSRSSPRRARRWTVPVRAAAPRSSSRSPSAWAGTPRATIRRATATPTW